jgi:hypothetical protein
MHWGVYWIQRHDVLEQHGVKHCLVNARGMKNVPGRRTDWHECQRPLAPAPINDFSAHVVDLEPWGLPFFSVEKR